MCVLSRLLSCFDNAYGYSTIVGPLSLYALKRDLFGAAIGLGLSDKEIANGR